MFWVSSPEEKGEANKARVTTSHSLFWVSLCHVYLLGLLCNNQLWLLVEAACIDATYDTCNVCVTHSCIQAKTLLRECCNLGVELALWEMSR